MVGHEDWTARQQAGQSATSTGFISAMLGLRVISPYKQCGSHRTQRQTLLLGHPRLGLGALATTTAT